MKQKEKIINCILLMSGQILLYFLKDTEIMLIFLIVYQVLDLLHL